jgi:hypothetical protein
MRLQLIARPQTRALSAWVLMALFLLPAMVRADASGEVDIAATLFHEGGGPLNMTVITPSARVQIDPIEEFGLHIGWDADVVSGASVAVVDAPSPEPDIITSATRLSDFRNVFSGGAEIRSDYGSIRAGYAYGFENDYRSHAFSLGARTELFERNTILDISFARGWDSVCDVFQPEAREAVDRRRLSTSAGCFSLPEFTARDVSLQTYQGSWTQAWASVFTSQLSISAQLVDGFQSNPYRAVWLGRSAAQENHPSHRARYAASLGLRFWLADLSSALQITGRVYRDTWDIMSVSAELGWEFVVDGAFRLRARGRYYAQSGAAFYSDDYALQPMGSYFTGDRELSPMSTVLAGLTLAYALTGTEQPVFGFLSEFDILLRGEWLHSDFPSYHYGQAGVPNTDALIATLSLEGHF